MGIRRTAYGIDIPTTTDFETLDKLKNILNEKHTGNNNLYCLAPSDNFKFEAFQSDFPLQIMGRKDVGVNLLKKGSSQENLIKDFKNLNLKIVHIYFSYEPFVLEISDFINHINLPPYREEIAE